MWQVLGIVAHDLQQLRVSLLGGVVVADHANPVAVCLAAERVDLGSVTRADTDKSKNKISVVQFMITGTLRGDQPLKMRRTRAAPGARSSLSPRQES